MTITEIKSHLQLIAAVLHYGLKPDAQNRLHCPWHEDKTPSLQLYPKTNTWTCFSSNCNAGSGDVIDFIMRMEHSNKYQAILKAKELIHLINPGIAPVQHQLSNNPAQNKKEKIAFLERIFTYFTNGLRGSTIGKKYLLSRGLNNEHLIAAGCIIGYHSGQYHRVENTFMEGSVRYGLLIPDNKGNTGGAGYNIWGKLSIVFPLKNKQGQIVSLYARSVHENKINKHYYLKDSEGLYPSYPIYNTQRLIITEAIIDAATLLQHKQIREDYTILSAYGTNRLTQEHIRAIHELKELKEIIFFFDGDEAGRKATLKYTEALHEAIPHVHISAVNTPEGEDINSLNLKYDVTCLLTLLQERKTLSEQNQLPQQLTLVPELPEETHSQTEIKKSNEPVFNNENAEALTYENEQLQIMILGGIKLSGLDRLKVTLKIKAKHNHYTPLRHNLDLYHTEQLLRLKQAISEQLEVSLTITELTLNGLIEALESYRLERIGSLQPSQAILTPLTETEINTTITYLKQPDLMQHTMQDIGKTGIIGEQHNRLIMYLVFLSRITSDPLHIISFGASGTGKTYLQEGVSALIPEENKLEITTLSGNALYYFKRDELKNKLIIIEDYDGVQDGLYPLRELTTKQKITKTVSLKDSKGNIRTLTFTVEGPVSITGCTTKESVYEDNANRCLLIYLDTSSEQDERIMDYQRNASAGLINIKEEKEYQTRLRNVQRLLKPIKVINPYAPFLKIPANVLKPRRSHKLYLRFIEIVTLYHQYQRTQRVDTSTGELMIETTFEDIAWANKLLKHILIRKADELSTACRNFFERLKKHLQEKNESGFKAKEIRGELRISASSLKKYLLELNSNGYIKVSSGSKARGYLYEVSSYEEYETLKSSINNVLDELLEKIKQEDPKSNPVVQV
jgi:DNA primase